VRSSDRPVSLDPANGSPTKVRANGPGISAPTSRFRQWRTRTKTADNQTPPLRQPNPQPPTTTDTNRTRHDTTRHTTRPERPQPHTPGTFPTPPRPRARQTSTTTAPHGGLGAYFRDGGCAPLSPAVTRSRADASFLCRHPPTPRRSSRITRSGGSSITHTRPSNRGDAIALTIAMPTRSTSPSCPPSLQAPPTISRRGEEGRQTDTRSPVSPRFVFALPGKHQCLAPVMLRHISP